MGQREKWIDICKSAACILIVAGHLLIGLDYAGILPAGGVHNYFIDTMYFFHVQLFFFCSGYLHQSRAKAGLSAHGKNILKKLVDLGVPYVTFTAASFLLKKLFEGSVNNPTNRTLIQMIFTEPDAPYWYLYILFFIFIITPKFKSKLTAGIFLGASAAASLGYQLFLSTTPLPYAVEWTMKYWVWFVLGMCAAKWELPKKNASYLKALPWIVFIPISILIYKYEISFPGMGLIMGVIGIGMSVTLSAATAKKFFENKNSAPLTKYVMPVFLMHTMASPAVRSVLLKLGVTSIPIHIIAGMAAGIILPIIVAFIMEKTVVLEFFLYPRKTVKKLKNKKTQNN